MSRKTTILTALLAAFVLVALCLFLLTRKAEPEQIVYGMSFNTIYATELGLPWKEVYDAILDDLGVRRLRLAAHWPLVEETPGSYSFEELDYQLARAEEVGADVIFGVGRRLPRWPECHVPAWAEELPWEEQKESIRNYIRAVVTRYKDQPSITYWQVENEPYLEVFAKERCGELDEAFLAEEIELVRELDDTRPILLTDSGNLGTWTGAYRQGDAFGTSVYVYFWNPEFGQFRTVLPPFAYIVKENLMKLLYGKKETFLIELSLEPWLVDPVTEVDLDTQYSRMDLEKMEEILAYAKDTRYERQYLWGAEWWYWLLMQGHPDMWNAGKAIFGQEAGGS